MTRAAAEIGAGLAAPRSAEPIQPRARIHIIGVAGAGASAAALLARAAGATVSGCDPGGPSPYSDAVEAAGIPIAWAHDAGHITAALRPNRVAVTKALTAIAPDHPELAAARAAGIVPEPWHQVVADAAFGRRLVAVAGTHGKSTTAGWLVHVLTAAGLDPSAFVGALLPASLTGGIPATARVGTGVPFVVEADEYAGNFDSYRPDVAVVTNVEWDHPDVFADLGATLDAFEGWLRRAAAARDRPTLVINVGDEGAARLRERLTFWTGPIVEVGVADDGSAAGESAVQSARMLGRIVETTPDGTMIDIAGAAFLRPLRVHLGTAGRHNVANAMAVAGAALALGVTAADLARGLESFPGVGRRLERLGEAGGVAVYDDYGHHPTAIRMTLGAVRQREPGRRIWAVYEPLTYHRTAAMLAEFAAALSTADAVAIADIWAGRDPDITVASAEGLASAIRARRSAMVVEATGSVQDTASWLASRVQPGDVVLVMGGGRSYQVGPLLLEALRR